MDFVTFLIIGIVIYSFFSGRGRVPQRTRRPTEHTSSQAEPQESSSSVRRKEEGFFESIKRQIRESAEALEKELQSEKGENENTGKKTSGKIPEKINRTSYEGTEGVWGVEGRSDYSRSQSKQGKQIAIETTIKTAKSQPFDYQAEKLESGLGLSSSDIVQGMIWSEILKEPRAKRPFFGK